MSGGGKPKGGAATNLLGGQGNVRPGVILEGYLFKSPPNISLRRMAEESRLQKRWFVLSNRTLTYYSDQTMSKPLSAVPLGSVTECKAK
eukprot:7390112-Prymnesium_polylepis.1